MNAPAKRDAGFTLVEVLVSLFIFSLLSAATLAVLTSTLQSRALLKQKSEVLQKQSVMRILLKSDFANAIAHPQLDPFGQPETVYFSGGNIGDERILLLSRSGWSNPGGIERRSDLQAVDYVLDDGVLIRRIKARFNALLETETYEQELAREVNQIRFEFYDGEQWRDNWITGAPPLGVAELPKLASVEIEYENGNNIRQIFWVGANQ